MSEALPLTEVIKEIVSDLMNADIASGLWDQSPLLIAVCAPRPDEPSKYRLAMVENIDPLWGLLHDPVMVLNFLATFITEAAGVDLPFGIPKGEVVRGIILRNEGYGLDSRTSTMTSEDMQAYTASGGRIADHPEGKEVKLYSSIVDDDHLTMLTHYRGTDGFELTEGGSGRVPDALKALHLAARLRWPA
jgi:hypothetical protein